MAELKQVEASTDAVENRISHAQSVEEQAHEAKANAELAWQQIEDERRKIAEEKEASLVLINRAAKAKKSILAARSRIDGELERLRKDREELEENRMLLQESRENVKYQAAREGARVVAAQAAQVAKMRDELRKERARFNKALESEKNTLNEREVALLKREETLLHEEQELEERAGAQAADAAALEALQSAFEDESSIQ